MKSGANILWLALFGFAGPALWLVASAVMHASIIGIPWGRGAFEMAKLSAVPFGRDMVAVSALKGREGIGWKIARFIGNLLWLPVGAFLCLYHLMMAAIFFVTILGIPFGLQHLKLAAIGLFPVGKRVVSTELHELVRKDAAERQLACYRGQSGAD